MAANGVYGTNIGALITNDDIEIFYSYCPTRNADDINNTKFKSIDSKLLTGTSIDDADNKYDNVLEGLYNLKLPLQYFNLKGYYTVYIKPKEHQTVIQDIGTLSSYPDVKGIVIDSNKVADSRLKALLTTNNNLVGYRIIYFDANGKRSDTYRIITSNNKCEPIVQNMPDVNQKSITYRYNENSSLIFITVTPSVATTFKPNAIPFIGNSMQQISIVNTKFEPVMLDIEMVNHDADTISTMLEGSQLRDLDHGLVTTYNEDNEIYAQHEHYTLKDEYNSRPVFEVKKNKNNSIDFSQTLSDKI